MKKFDVVIIGGDPAGIQVVVPLRSTNPDKSITLDRKENTALIPRAIPYILHSLKLVDDDIMSDELLKKNNIELILGEVIDRDAKIINLIDVQQIEFNKPVLATGFFPVMSSISGIDNKSIHILSKDYESLVEMRNAAKSA